MNLAEAAAAELGHFREKWAKASPAVRGMVGGLVAPLLSCIETTVAAVVAQQSEIDQMKRGGTNGE